MTALSDLTEAQAKLIDLLPSDGSELHGPYVVVCLGDSWKALGELVSQWLVQVQGSPPLVRLTTAGLALKRERMAQGGEGKA